MAKNDIEDINADYEKAGFGGSLGFGDKPALIIIDMCRAYLDPEAPLYAGIEKEHANIARLLTAFRAAGLPVIHTRVEYAHGGADGGYFFKKVAALKCFEKDADGNSNPLGFPPENLKPLAGEVVVTKQYASAFAGTSLAATMASMGIDTAVITGVSTSGCVRASGLDALQNGFIPIMVEDACGDRDQAIHDANMFDLQAKYADLMSTNELIAKIS